MALSHTCSRFYTMLPKYSVLRGKDFTIKGPNGGHWAPEKYFDTRPFTSAVKKLSLSLTWMDQGWGNRKGEIFLKLMRPGRFRTEEVAEMRKLAGIAQHEEETFETEVTAEPVIALARAGDYYRFMRNAGGGGGHKLIVKNFRLVLTLDA